MSVTIELPRALQTQAEALAAERGMDVEALLAELLADSLVAYATGSPAVQSVVPGEEQRPATSTHSPRAFH